MDLKQERNKLQALLDQTTEEMNRASSKCKALAIKIRKLDKAIEKNQELLNEINQPNEPEAKIS